MNKSYLVSIAVFTYNGEKYIEEQLTSLLHQTYTNIEILIFDDASTDNTVDIIKKYTDERIICYINEKNLGVLKNVEQALQKTSGEYIAMCDQDDVWMPNKIEVLVKNMEDNSMVYSAATLVDENMNILEEKINRATYSGKNYKFFWFTNFVSGHTLMIKKDVLKIAIPFPDHYIHPDWWIAYSAAVHGNIKFIDIPLVYYRQHENQITKKNNIQRSNQYFQKLFLKDQKNKKRISTNINLLKSFSSLKLFNSSDQTLLSQLYENFLKLPKSYFNIKLFYILFINRNLLFLNKNNKKSALSFAKGIWFDRINSLLVVILLSYIVYYIATLITS